ncbi:Ferrichrome-iron receptor AltName: Full=Ferric hydroxamate uptake [Fibrisoma limi BUZ 3]|uniref:WGS project CAIT00000000 data, contig 4 n=1 Tax=Fibrisoma limi BUZ 3 TaxID=1185876 RepID=I2GBG8_9BACT|nr:TonB-dependent receptor [Fibrisoma limi]CCH51242.1 Ferrichrome-iron receptor AltName: Full=Ferric hydroxamate uptake [Fibrisoma limi BUZ 3]
MRFILLITFISFISVVTAQPPKGTLRGIVTTADGQPAAFVNVMLKGSKIGVTTDEDGSFTLRNLPEGAQTLLVSSVGFEPVEQAVTVSSDPEAKVSLSLKSTAKQLGEVVVTGQKRRTSSATRTNQELIDIPMAIQVVGQEVIQKQNAFDMATIVRNVAGVNLSGTYGGQNTYQYFNARGFDLNNWQNYRRNGFMIWNMGTHFNDNIESVEFLKGPTAILYGDVAPGGVMNLVTKKPLNYNYRRVEMKVGQYGLFRPTVDVSGPINRQRTLLYRLNATYERSNSFRDYVKHNAVMFAPSILWKISPRLDWNVEYTYKKTTASDDPGLVSPDGTFDGLSRIPYNRYLSEPGVNYGFSDQGVYSTLTYQINSQWRVRNLAGYSYTVRNPASISTSGIPDPDGRVDRFEYNYRQWFDIRTVSLELLGEVNTGSVKHHLLAGVEYNDSFSRYSTGAGYNKVDSTFNIFNPQYGRIRVADDTSPFEKFRFYYIRHGLYVQDQLSFLNDKVQLLLGVRFNRTEQGNRYDNEAERPETDKPSIATPVSPRFGLVFKPVSWLSAFASYSKSYEVNAPDVAAENANQFTAPAPTIGEQVEIGMKGNLLQQRLGVTLTAFQINKNNVFGYVYLDPINPSNQDFKYNLYSGGRHRSRGVELDVNGKVTPELNLIASASYIDAVVVSDPAYKTGNWLGAQPRNSYSLWADYRFDRVVKGLTLGYGVFHRGQFYGTTENVTLTRSYTTMDASVGYRFKGFNFLLTVSNLANRKYYLQSFSPTAWEPQWTRRAVLSVAYKF